MKVVTAVAYLIDHLPEHCLMEEPEAPESPVDEHSGLLIGEDGQNKKDPDAIRKQVCAEILNTERSFVRDLEVMQVCCCTVTLFVGSPPWSVGP
jgi:hypothetical protein